MNIGAVSKFLFRGCQPSCSLLPKPCCYALSSLARQHELLSRTLPSSLAPSISQGRRPVLHCGTPTTPQQTRQFSDFSIDPATIWEDIKQMKFSPVPALVLGFSGLVPFLVPPAYMLITQTFVSKLAFAQNLYGACVLSFLGGVRWGFVIPEGSTLKPNWSNFGYSMFPSFMAWTALMMPHTAATLALMGGVAGAAYIDTAIKGYPPWFKGLRFTLSIGVMLSLWTVLLCKATLSPHIEGELDASHVNKFGGSLSVRAVESAGDEDEKMVGKDTEGEEKQT